MHSSTRIHLRTHRGMALMLVLPAVALATVLAYAVLANIGTQEQISANSASIAQADALAESGVNYAMYNLQYPSNAPSYGGSFWAGPSGNISLGASVPGTFNVSVALSGSNYIVTSTGTVTASTGTVITRTIHAAVHVVYQAVQPNQAAGFNGDVVLATKMKVIGDLRATGKVTLNTGSSVTGPPGGDIYSSSLVMAGGTTSGSFVQVPGTGVTAPTSVNDFRTYTYNGGSYSGTQLTTSPVAGTVLGPTPTNPAGVYYAQGINLNLNGITINGTLIAKKTTTGGGVVVASSAVNTITPMSGFPGLVVDAQIVVAGTAKQLVVNGLTWAGTGLTGSGVSNSGSKITVNGSLLIPSTSGVGAYTGSLNLNYNAANVAVPNFSSQMQVPKNITVVGWSQP